MEERRLLIAIALAGMILFGWQVFLSKSGLEKQMQPPRPVASQPAGGSAAPAGISGATTPANPAGSTAALSTPAPSPALAAFTSAAPESLSVVDTDNWKIVLTNKGARPDHWVLKNFRRGDGRPVDLIPRDGGLERLALRSGGSEVNLAQATYDVVGDRREGDARVVTYRTQSQAGRGLSVTYRFPRTGHVASVKYEVLGGTADDKIVVEWRSWKFTTETNQTEDMRQARVSSLLGEELVEDHLPAFNSKTPQKVHSGNVQWAVLRSKYFALGFLFPQEGPSEVTALGDRDSNQVGVRFESASLGRKSVDYEMYVGPVDFWKLQPADHQLTRLLDISGFFKFMAPVMVPLNRLMLKFFTLTHKFVPNYGLVIIVLSVVVRLVFYPLSQSQMRSMQKMQELQPVMERIRQKYKNDQEKLNKEVLKLYQENKVNPFGGCLPILAQMPVFISLFNVLSGSIELRQAGFFGWITDLSAPDVLMTLGGAVGGFPLHVLPLIMAGTMFWQQKLTPMDPRQAATGYVMPVVMLFVFYRMPSGLVLYWTVTNILTALQQMQLRAAKPAAVTS